MSNWDLSRRAKANGYVHKVKGVKGLILHGNSMHVSAKYWLVASASISFGYFFGYEFSDR
jgi:hypothetical protein